MTNVSWKIKRAFTLVRETLAIPLSAYRESVWCDIHFAQHEWENGNHAGLDGVIYPTSFGVTLLTVWDKYVMSPCRMIRIAFCDHKNMEDHGYGGPDTGCDAGECPDCGFSYHHTLY